MEYKYEMHCHTANVSRCGKVDIKDIVKMYQDKEYSGIVLTDHYSPLTFYNHNLVAPQKKIDFYLSAYREIKKYASDDFSIMLGMELRHYATGNDYLIYGIDDKWLEKQGNLMALWEKPMYNLMHAQGYLVYQAHPFRPYIYRCNPKYIDGVEIYNGKTDKVSNERAFEWAEKNGKLMVSGSDFHAPEQIARGGIITNKPIRNNAELIDMLKSMDFKMIKTY